MDFYQAVIVEYLRLDRAVFLYTECCAHVRSSLERASLCLR